MADYLEKLKEEYPGMFGPVGAAPAIASSVGGFDEVMAFTRS